ncbi:MAG: GAF domain-containing protein [Symploca sp. SIO1C2]|nr:GAF domain-containing protein [Symploca sp. SIO1C2]
MNTPSSLLQELLQALPDLRPQSYFKSSLTALSHAIEDLILARTDSPLVIANFQQECFFCQEVHRYRQIAQRTNQVYVLAVPEAESNLAEDSQTYEFIPLEADEYLAQEWHLIVIGEQYAACIVCQEQATSLPTPMDQARQFEGIWTFDRHLCAQAARMLLGRIAAIRPELVPKVEEAWQHYHLTTEVPTQGLILTTQAIESEIFVQRLITYLQTSQHQLLEAYQTLATQERKEYLINAITTAVRHSLNPHKVLAVAVRELGQTFAHCRCILYRCSSLEEQITIEHEALAPGLPSLRGKTWPLADNPLIQVALAQEQAIAIANTDNSNLQSNPVFQTSVQRGQIRSWLLVPIRHQDTLLGMIELHYGGSEPDKWQEDDISVVKAIATQVGVALTQAQTYAQSEALNRQLEALERTQSNLIAIVGHELRTPLSTIQVCLESLAEEPEMPSEFQQAMLETALNDAERLRKLIQDFLTLSRLESGQLYRNPESIQLQEAIDLSLTSLQDRRQPETLPQITVELPANLPPVIADGDELVDVLNKLLDNACKFTNPDGQVKIQVKIFSKEVKIRQKVFTGIEAIEQDSTSNKDEALVSFVSYPEALQNESPAGATQTKNSGSNSMLEVIVADTGRGIEANQLEVIFDRFYQEEGALRRTAGGTGLGLAICRCLVEGLGGEIWAESAGKNQGSQFHFTVPIEISKALIVT